MVDNSYESLKLKDAADIVSLPINYFIKLVNKASYGKVVRDLGKIRSDYKAKDSDIAARASHIMRALCKKFCMAESLEVVATRAATSGDESKDAIDDADTVSITPPAPATPADNGIVSMINDLIIDEWKTIDAYNAVIATINRENSKDMYADTVKVLTDIADEEHAHVGELQYVMSMMAPQVDTIKSGEREAADLIDEGENG